MAGNLTLSLLTAQSGLLANQGALDTSANNIANAHTEGYSRKIASFEQRTVAGAGAGVQIGAVVRRVDEGLLKALRRELGAKENYQIQDLFFARVQETFGSPADNTSIAHKISDIAISLESLAVSPEKILDQSELVSAGREAAIKLETMSKTLQDLRLQADRDIANYTYEINDLVSEISRLNDSIVRNSVVNQDVTDLADQRDKALDTLSSIIDINYFTRSDGGIIVFTPGGQTLVDNIPVTVTHTAAGATSPATTYATGSMDGINITVGQYTNDITGNIRDGALKGLIEMRDVTLPSLQSQIDELSSKLRDTFNEYHNRGTAVPAPQDLSGTRRFVDETAQTIEFTSGTTKIVLLDNNGDQLAVGDLAAAGGILGPGAHTIDAVAAGIQGWLQANGAPSASVTFDAQNRMNINLNTTGIGVGFRDEDATGAHVDASIAFDKNADGTADETYGGFSNFFGLNDFFIDDLQNNIKDSQIRGGTFTTGPGTLAFYDGPVPLVGSPLFIDAGSSMQDIAERINQFVPDMLASVVPDGTGFRLRVQHQSGKDFEITQTVGTILTDLGMHDSNVGVSQSFTVRRDIEVSPALVARGAVQWDATLGAAGEYYVSAGDGSMIQSLATRFNESSTFDAAGDLGDTTLPFDQYAAAILSRNTSQANSIQGLYENKQFLSDSLQNKSDTVRGVNLDEEMSNLVLFEQAYSASARVISVIQSMLDALERAVG